MSAKKKEYPTIIESDVKLIRKSNELVEARYKFDIWETRVFAYMLTLVNYKDEDFVEYTINTGDILREFELNDSGAVYESLKNASGKLLDKKVGIIRVLDDGRKELFTTHLVASTATPEEDRKGDYIKLSFHPALKPFLLELKERYLVYDIRNILMLTSIYSVRLFELLKQYQKIGKRKFSIDELKVFLSIEPHEYRLFGHFKGLLQRAQLDLKKNTDIYFEIEEVKAKNKVTHLIFNIFDNLKAKPVVSVAKENIKINPKALSTVEYEHEKRIFEQVSDYVTKKKVREWLSNHPVEQIERGINYVKNYIKNGKKVNNIGGLLNTMVATPNLYDKFETIEKAPSVQNLQKKPELEKVSELLEYLNRIKLDFEIKREKLETAFFQNNPNMENFVTEKVKSNMLYDRKISFEENMERSSIKGFWQSVVSDVFPAYFELTENYFSETNKCEKYLKELDYRR